MKKHGPPVTYALFPDEGHGFARPENNIAFVAIAEAFLSAHLGGVYLPVAKEELAASSMNIMDGREASRVCSLTVAICNSTIWHSSHRRAASAESGIDVEHLAATSI
jgi:hypothetical protein